MWQVIFSRLFNKKRELFVLGMVVIACTLLSKYVAVSHWQSIDYDLSSYSIFTPIIGGIWMLSGLGVLILRRIKSPSLYIMFLVGLFYMMIMFWAIWIR